MDIQQTPETSTLTPLHGNPSRHLQSSTPLFTLPQRENDNSVLPLLRQTFRVPTTTHTPYMQSLKQTPVANQNLPLPKTPTATVMVNSHTLQDPLCNSLLSPRLYLPSQTKAPHTQVIQKSPTLSQLSQTLLSFPSKKVSHAGNRGLSDL